MLDHPKLVPAIIMSLRQLLVRCLCVAAVVCCPGLASAQFKEYIRITSVRMGLPNGAYINDTSKSNVFRSGQWAPIYVDLECVRDTEVGLRITATTTDTEGEKTEAWVDIPPMYKDDKLRAAEIGRCVLLKPGGNSPPLTVTVTRIGERGTAVYGPSRLYANDGKSQIILNVGTTMASLNLPSGGNDFGNRNRNDRRLRGGFIETTQITELGLLPEHWFGYNLADLMLLGTASDRKFWEDINQPQHTKRRQAIVEWVRRGGKLIISVGTNVDAIEAIKEFKELLPATLDLAGKQSIQSLAFYWKYSSNYTISNSSGLIPVRDKGEIVLAKLVPKADRLAKVVAQDTNNIRADTKPLVITGPVAQGQVTVVAFDLDKGPFADWVDKPGFWENLISSCGFTIPSSTREYERFSTSDAAVEGAQISLQGNLDYFDSVPIVSFGWVALFIFGYILLIGPIDYFLLKKVIRRMEFTWITFPIFVIGVSAAAYYAAFAIKGTDLRINKTDVVDIDLSTKRIDGTAWFTLFSPRDQRYQLSIEPTGTNGAQGEPNWSNVNPAEGACNSLVSWMGNAKDDGSSGGGVFSNTYRYQLGTNPFDPDKELYGCGLDGTKIQVWTTKTFMGQYTGSIDPNNPPIIANLSVSRNSSDILQGTITNNLPTDNFTDIGLMWRGKVYMLTDFSMGATKSINLSVALGEGSTSTVKDFRDWLNESNRRSEFSSGNSSLGYTPRGGSAAESGTPSNPNFRLWGVMFYDLTHETNARDGSIQNLSLRKLDHSGRVNKGNSEYAILLLRCPATEGPGEEMTKGGSSPSRLWIGALPGTGKPRPEIVGRLKQETYVRVLIPVKTSR